MRLFSCSNCRSTVHFDNSACLTCGSGLGYRPSSFEMVAMDPSGNVIGDSAGSPYEARLCSNSSAAACNWLVEDDEPGGFCLACRHNTTIPDLGDLTNAENWRKIEAAKRYLFYSLMRFRLPLITRTQDPQEGLAFDFLADNAGANDAAPVLTGHDSGLITLNIAEASDAEREARRVSLGEPFRTLVGHFRHEIGHYYWDRLVRDGGHLDQCRAVFGDDSQDYNGALQQYYANGPQPGWDQAFISAYASCHPWEDFAETWAHYFHIVDALETAHAFGLRTQPETDSEGLALRVTFDPYKAFNATVLVNAWVPLTLAVNSINRSMGQRDLYPFVLSVPVAAKLEYIHQLIHGAEGPET